jgi:hypothetical protein
MPSSTETNLQAFVALLAALAVVDSPAVPAPLRNEVLPSRMSDFGQAQAFLNVLDGEAAGSDEGGAESVALGDSDTQYDLSHEPQVEWIYAHADPDERESGFDAGLTAIYDAVTAENAIDGVTVTLKSLQRSNLNTEGLPGTKAAVLVFRLTFLSSRPF